MTIPFVNTEPFPVQRVVATAYGVVSGVNLAVATLPATQYNRWLRRIMLTTALQSTMVGTPANWDNYNQDVKFRLTLGSPDNGNLLDQTNFGQTNVNEYQQPIKLPGATAVYLCWYDVIPTFASLCTATLTLANA